MSSQSSIYIIHHSVFTRSEDYQNLLDYFGKRTYAAKSRQVISQCMYRMCVCMDTSVCYANNLAENSVRSNSLIFFPSFIFSIYQSEG